MCIRLRVGIMVGFRTVRVTVTVRVRVRVGITVGFRTAFQQTGLNSDCRLLSRSL